MNNLKIFENAEFGQIRTVQLKNETYFVGKDVADALGYANPKNAVPKHVNDEDKLCTQIEYAGQRREVTVINESGLYALIFGSKLESAKRFKHWVTSEVLPSIRKHGVYAVDELLDNPDMAIKAFSALKEEREKNKALLEDNQRMRPKEIFADAVSASHTSILVGDLAKLINQNGVDIGAKRLFAWLRENSYLIKRKGTDYNLPTQKSMDLGLFEIKETAISHSDGHIAINRTPKVTGKGQNYFVNKFLGEERSA